MEFEVRDRNGILVARFNSIILGDILINCRVTETTSKYEGYIGNRMWIFNEDYAMTINDSFRVFFWKDYRIVKL